MKKEFKVCPIRYKSAERLFVEYLGYDWPVKNKAELMRMEVEDGDRKHRRTVAQRIVELEQLGYWAFCRRQTGHNDNELHYWIGRKLDRARLVSVFAHELAHLIGWSDETAAIKIADIAGFACELAEDVHE